MIDERKKKHPVGTDVIKLRDEGTDSLHPPPPF